MTVALAARFGARSLPADPLARAAATLRGVAGRSRLVHAVLWRDTHVLAANDPAALYTLLSRWSYGLPQRVLPVLTAPPPVAAVADAPAAARTPIEPDVAVLASAPSRAWWKPRPGELG